MKGIGKGWLIASGVILVLAVICLCGSDVQAFLGGVVVAGIVLAVGSRKSKHRTAADVPPVASRGGVHEIPRPTPSVSVAHDLDGSSGSSFGSWDVSIHGADGQDVRMDRALFQIGRAHV